MGDQKRTIVFFPPGASIAQINIKTKNKSDFLSFFYYQGN